MKLAISVLALLVSTIAAIYDVTAGSVEIQKRGAGKGLGIAKSVLGKVSAGLKGGK